MIIPSTARGLALDQLSRIKPVEYGQSRNYLNGSVTRLSAYLRHGVLSLAEVRDAAVAIAGDASRCQKLLQELAWRDYYQRLWHVLGARIWRDIEPYKTGLGPADYAESLPENLLNAATGIDYIDNFVEQLHTTGYLHNHARMWLAAYTVHGLRVRWQAGARWFLSHLLDGDEASNNLSWQRCASTFSQKPYIYNRENVLKYSDNHFAAHQSCDPFDTDYETLERKLFKNSDELTGQARALDLRTQAEPQTSKDASVETRVAQTLVWVHDGMMSSAHPAIALGKDHVFVWDDQHLAESNQSVGRLSFQRSALFCRDVHSQHRPLAELLLDLAREGRFQAIVTGQTSDPRLLAIIEQLRSRIMVHVVPEQPFVELNESLDLTRFSRYWAKAQNKLL